MWRMWQQGDFGCTMLDWCIHRHIQNIIYVFLVCPILMPVFFFLFHKLTRIEYRNWPWQGFDIISIEYWMRQDSSSKLFDRESSSLSTRPDFHPIDPYFYVRIMIFFFKENVCLVQKKEVRKTRRGSSRRDIAALQRFRFLFSPKFLSFPIHTCICTNQSEEKRSIFLPRRKNSGLNFHQHFTSSLFIWKFFFAKLFCTYSLCS